MRELQSLIIAFGALVFLTISISLVWSAYRELRWQQTLREYLRTFPIATTRMVVEDRLSSASVEYRWTIPSDTIELAEENMHSLFLRSDRRTRNRQRIPEPE